MKIAVVSGVFPSPSETFALNQVTGLLRLGHDARILTGRLLLTSLSREPHAGAAWDGNNA